ncbi:MAG: pentapeptide repeat-containing protein, partial [Actinobacteria bacterium]|nr:pentapeptide repeat-containing protein [Actinomycetota bacterium]
DMRAEGASFRGVDLSGALLQGANLSECDLRGSDLSTIDPTTVRLRGAIIGWQQAVQLAQGLGLEVAPD